MAKWLIIGVSGLLGRTLVLEGRKRGTLVGTYYSHPVKFRDCHTVRLDASDLRQVEGIVAEIEPDWIVYAAALANVDRCEKRPDEAMLLNALVPAGVAGVAARSKRGFIYISTDMVFDGRGNFSEIDEPHPVNVYARSKLEGESRVQEVHPGALVIRTNFFGCGTLLKQSYTDWLLQRLRSEVSFPVFSDVWFNPLLMNSLVTIIMDLAEQGVTGLVHVGNSTPSSKLQFARELALHFGLHCEGIRSVRLEDIQLAAPRPRNMVLRCRHVETILGMKMPSLNEEFNRLRRLLGENLAGEVQASV